MQENSESCSINKIVLIFHHRLHQILQISDIPTRDQTLKSYLNSRYNDSMKFV